MVRKALWFLLLSIASIEWEPVAQILLMVKATLKMPRLLVRAVILLPLASAIEVVMSSRKLIVSLMPKCSPYRWIVWPISKVAGDVPCIVKEGCGAFADGTMCLAPNGELGR